MWKWLKNLLAGPVVYSIYSPDYYDLTTDIMRAYDQLKAENAELRARIKEMEKDLETNSSQLVARNNAIANLSAERDTLRSTLSVYEEDDCA